MPDPPPTVDWGRLLPALRPGDRVCTTHGRIAALQAPMGVPICPHCRQMALLARFRRDGKLAGFAEPTPSHCADPERHPLVGGAVRVSWLPCECLAALDGPGGHREWQCSACLALSRRRTAVRWPPCELLDA